MSVARNPARIRKMLAWTGVALVAFAVLGFFVAPALVRPALERKLSAALERNVTIARLDINPFAISTTIHGLAVSARGEGAPLFTLDELYANAEMMSLFRWAPVIRELRLSRPVLNLVRNADKTYNFSDLLDRAQTSQPDSPAGPPRFSVSNIEIVDGAIAIDDRPEHRQHRITALNVGIPFLSSLPSQVEIKVRPHLSAEVNGHPVAVSGETRPFADTHETVLHFELADLALPTYADYAPTPLPVKVESGLLGAKFDVTFVDRRNAPPELTLAGTIHLADLVLRERSGAPLVRVPSLDVDIARLDVFGRRVDVRAIVAEGVDAQVRREADGSLNLMRVKPADATPARGATPFRFVIERAEIHHGRVGVADASVAPAFAATLVDVEAGITHLESSGDRAADVDLSFATDKGARFTHYGTLGLAPLRAEGRLEIAGLRLAVLYPYYASALNLAVDDGTLAGSTRYRFAGDSAALTLEDLDASASNVKLRLPRQKDPLWRVGLLAVHGGTVEVSRRAVSFESIEGRGAVASIRRHPDGSFNFAQLVRGPARDASPASAGDAWAVQTRRFALEDLAATFVDETVTPPAHIALTRLTATAEGLSSVPKSKGRLSVRATINRRGSLSFAGPFSMTPFATKLDVVARDVDLVAFAPYIARDVRIDLTGGKASARGALSLTLGAAMHGGFRGEVAMRDVAALDEANKTDLVKWKTLALRRVDAQLEPLAVSVGEIALDEFFARLLLNENGEFNLQQLARSHGLADGVPAMPDDTAQSTPAAASSSVSQAASSPVSQAASSSTSQSPASASTLQPPASPSHATTWLKLGTTTLTAGSIDFTDHFIKPNYSASLTGLAGTLSTLAFDQPADVDLRGTVQGNAPIQISGRINPLAQNLFLDIKARATDIELSPLSPYSGKYVGYGIEKGKLSMNVSYHVEDRKLQAQNSIVLDQLTFGQKVESPDAIKAPVQLAVALLKDRNGVIQFDLPVGGSIDDPQFSVAGLVFRALVNLVVRAVTAPFALLGSLGGGQQQELSYVEFAPGSAVLDANATTRIKALAKALNDRPGIKLDVAGRSDANLDREALRRAAVDRLVRVQRFNELPRSGKASTSVDAVEVPPEEYDALLLRAYKAADFPKPRNAIGLLKDLPRAEMEALLLANAKVGEDDLRGLAERRAQAVRTNLVDGEHVAADRLYLVAPHLDGQGIKDKGKPTRVDFALH